MVTQTQQYDALNITDGSDLDSSQTWVTTQAGPATGVWTYYSSASPTLADSWLGVYTKPGAGGPETGTNIRRAFATGAAGGILSETQVTVSILCRPTESGASGWGGATLLAGHGDDLDAGLIVRATGTSWGVDSWYEIGVTNVDDQNSGSLSIRRVNAGATTVLSTATFASIDANFNVPAETSTVTGALAPFGVPFKIVAICKNVGGDVQISVSITNQDPVAKSIGLSYLDNAANRITAAGYGGFYATADKGASLDYWVHFTDWLLKAEYDETGNPEQPDEAGDDVPSLTAEPTLSAIAIANEGTASGTLSPAPQLEIPMAIEYTSVEAPTESGHVVTFAKFATARRRFELRWEAVSNADAATLSAFFRSHTGSVTPFTYASPHWGNVTVIFEDGSWREETLSPTAKRCSARVREVL